MKSKNKTIYWISTILFALPLGASGICLLLELPMNVEGLVHLGYPVYMARFFGLAKVLGILAIVSNKFPKLKEWAYAGFTFNLLGASYSHFSSGDGPKLFLPLILLIIMLISYSQWNMHGTKKRS